MVLVLIQKEQVICCLLSSYCNHSLYFVSVDHCCWKLRGAGTPADPDDSFFFWPSIPLSEGFSKFVVIASFWFSSVAVGFALLSSAGAKYEDIRFMTLTCHASCLNLPLQSNSQCDLDAWKRLYIKLSNDTDKDCKNWTYFGTDFRNLLPGRSQKVKKQCARFGPVDHFNRVRKTKIVGMAHSRLNTACIY